jgi:hypothetical protein
MENTRTVAAPSWRRGFVALGVSALLVGGLAACDSAGPEEGATVEDVTEDDVVEDASPTPDEGDTSDDVMDGYDGPYDVEFGDSADYVGQTVTLSAAVNSVLNEHAFTIGDAVGMDPLLVISGDGVLDLEEGQNVRVTGEVIEELVLSDLEPAWGIDLDDEEWSGLEGETYVEAESVETDVDFEDE